MKNTILLSVFSVLTVLLLGSCASDSSSPASAGASGKGGSMARFAVSGNHLYTVNMQSMQLFDISNAAQPQPGQRTELGWGIETVFPYGEHLFIGTRNGMHIYNISTPSTPTFVSTYQHIFSCDPVVVQDTLAFVTLSVGTPCGRGVNQLEVINIRDLYNPTNVATYQMEKPLGLGIDGRNLFVCDNGLKAFKVLTAYLLNQVAKFDIPAYDVIPLNGNLLVSAEDGLYQYSYNDSTISLLSKLDIIPIH